MERRVTTVGRVHPHLEAKVIDPGNGRVVPHGTVSATVCCCKAGVGTVSVTVCCCKCGKVVPRGTVSAVR